MRLKQVKLSGFKSFCDSAEFKFKENGITMVVGPNGCGKSNVVDAVRWALGEQSPRQMRGNAMADVIFAGSSSRKPVGRAEVTLMFDNEAHTALEKFNEFSEISITRRLYRSGESEYLINKAPCRLLDIRELVMDTGIAGRSYSIVEQGRVDEFITASPQDRRSFLEEAAGIMRFKTRRIAAEKKLEQTRMNLRRVEDLLTELKRQEGVLHHQMETAREFRALQTEAGLLEGDLARLHHAKIAGACADLESRLAELQQDAFGMGGELARKNAILEQFRVDQTRQEASLKDCRAALHGKEREIQADEGRLNLGLQNQENIRAWISNMEKSLEEMNQRRDDAVGQAQSFGEQSATLEEQSESLHLQLLRLEEQYEERQGAAQALTAKLTTLNEEQMECIANLRGNENQQEFLTRRLADGEQRRTALQERLAEVEREKEEVRSGLSTASEQARETESAQQAAQASIRSLGEELEDMDQAIALHLEREEEAAGEARECRSRLDTLVEIEAGYEGFGESVRALLQWCEANPEERKALGVIGPLSDLVSVPADLVDWAGDYLAPYLETIVVERAGAFPAIADRLHALDIGGVRFLALDTVASLPAGSNGGGAHGESAHGKDGPGGGESLAPLLDFSGEAEALGAALFGATRLLPEGTAPHPLPEPIGAGVEWLSRDGAYSIDGKSAVTLGRSRAPAAGLLRRRSDIAALESRLTGLEDARNRLQAQGEDRKARREELAVRLRAQETLASELTLAGKELERDHAHAERELERLEQVHGNVSREAAQFQEELSGSRNQQAELTAESERWREARQRLEETLSTLRTEEEDGRAKAMEVQEELSDCRVEHGRVQSRLEGLRARLASLEEDGAQMARKLEETETQREAQREKLSGTAQEIEVIKLRLTGYQESMDHLRLEEIEQIRKFEELDDKTRKLAGEVHSGQSRLDAQSKKIHELELEQTKENVKLEQFVDQLAGLPAREEGSEGEIGDVSSVERKLNSAKAKLLRMEGVNLGAPEEYEALETRLDFLAGQGGDLNKAIEDLEASIRRMNAESRRRFKETFDRVNEKFQTLFPKIFRGGEACLVLTDSEDPLVAGVDIVAQPPGKKLQSLNLLSGGEKALTAIALIFSFFLYKPSPFCFLDEVDAPLDDVNVSRFNQLVQNMTDQSQFIIITHNKRTMEVADRMYGVTMEEAGVSKIVSVNLS